MEIVSDGSNWLIVNSRLTSYHFLRAPSGHGSTNTKIRTFGTVDQDHGNCASIVQSATNGDHFLINLPGVYSVSYTDQFTGANSLGVTLNSASLTTSISSFSPGSEILTGNVCAFANNPAACSYTGYFASNDILRPHTDGTATGTATEFGQFAIARVG